MTTTTETTTAKEKQAPAFYIFSQSQDGKNMRLGAAFRHSKGSGFNVLIGNTRYVAFPPKAQSATTTEGKSA